MKSSSDGGTQVLLVTSALLSVFSYCLCVLSVPYAPFAAVATSHSWGTLRVVTNASSIGGSSACGTGCSALGPTIVADNTTGRLFVLFAYIPRDMDTHTDLLLQGSHSIYMVSTMDGVNWSPPRNLSPARPPPPAWTSPHTSPNSSTTGTQAQHGRRRPHGRRHTQAPAAAVLRPPAAGCRATIYTLSLRRAPLPGPPARGCSRAFTGYYMYYAVIEV